MWSSEELENMKNYSEIEIYYDMLNLMLELEPVAIKAAGGNQRSMKRLRRDSLELRFLASFLREKTRNILSGKEDEVPNALLERIKKEENKKAHEEKLYRTRMKNLKKSSKTNDKRIDDLIKAKEELKKKYGEKKKKEEQS